MTSTGGLRESGAGKMAAGRGWVVVFLLVMTTQVVRGDVSKLDESWRNACRFKPSVSNAHAIDCDFDGINSNKVRHSPEFVGNCYIFRFQRKHFALEENHSNRHANG